MVQARNTAKDETTTPEVLATLAKSEDYLTRLNVASNPNTTLNILEKLANNSHPCIRRGVAVRPDVPKSFLPRIFTGVVNSLFSRFSTLEKQKSIEQLMIYN